MGRVAGFSWVDQTRVSEQILVTEKGKLVKLSAERPSSAPRTLLVSLLLVH